jgi:NAD(P)-dependent dehydrogenase (short-subunit alcohol dehydrogenase family)
MQFRSTMEVNFFAVVAVTKACLPMLKRARGRVVTLSSMAGLVMGAPTMAAYAASKHAVEAFTSSLRFELQPLGVRVITVNRKSCMTTATMLASTPSTSLPSREGCRWLHEALIMAPLPPPHAQPPSIARPS